MDKAGCIRVLPFLKSARSSSYRLAWDDEDEWCILPSLLESSDEQAGLSDGSSHPGRFDATAEKENRKTSMGSHLVYEQDSLWELRKYVLLLATLAATVTYSAALNPPGGIWSGTGWAYSRYQGSNKQFKDEPRSWMHFSCTLVIVLLCSLPYLSKATGIPLKASAAIASTLAIELLCTLLNLFKAIKYYFCGSDSIVAKDNAVAEAAATWQVASASTHHATGNRALFSDLKTVDDLNILTGDGRRMPVCGRGTVITDTVVLPDVWYVPELKRNIVSVSQLAELDCSIVFKREACYISDATDGTIIGKALVEENGLFKLEFLKVPLVN